MIEAGVPDPIEFAHSASGNEGRGWSQAKKCPSEAMPCAVPRVFRGACRSIVRTGAPRTLSSVWKPKMVEFKRYSRGQRLLFSPSFVREVKGAVYT